MTRRSVAARAYANANVDAVSDAIRGRGPDASSTDDESGAHAVANIPSVHVPSFVHLSAQGHSTPYKNGYDLEHYHVGERPGAKARKRREVVDEALPLRKSLKPREVYFCAVDLNGYGVRFYGDFSLVIRNEHMKGDTVVLDRNSYDLERSPISDRVRAFGTEKERDRARRKEMTLLAGLWEQDLAPIAVTKVFNELGGGERRLTTGQISEALLGDEDYVEVLRIGSFNAAELVEARVSASDSALEALISSRLPRGPVPRWAEIIWRQRRRAAERALRDVGVATHVVVTTGRVKT